MPTIADMGVELPATEAGSQMNGASETLSVIVYCIHLNPCGIR